AAFIKAFQELVTTFRSVSDKFKFVWDTTNDGGNMNPEKAYPGDKYVDVIGTDVFYSTQWDGTDAAKGFKGEVTRTYGLQWQQDFAAAHGKATAISEWGVASDNAGPYVQAMTKWMADHNMVYENYWDSNADYSGKLSTGANATAGAAYKSAISSLQGAATSLPLTVPSVAITSAGGLTNTLAVKLVGTVGLSDVGTTVHVLDGSTEIGTAIVQADGKWSAAVSLLNQQGTHQITASDANAAGTGKSSIVSYTVDTVAPLLSVSGSVSGLTNKASNTVTVTSSDSTSGMRSVEIYDNGSDLGAATQRADGSWVFTTAKLTDGTHSFTAVATDNAGNKSGAVSAGNSVVVDTVAPVVKLGLVQNTGTSSTDKVTTNPALIGTAEAGAKVTLSEDTTTLGSVTADSTGHWSFTPTTLKLGEHTILASQTDAAGNTGSDTLLFNLKSTAPASTTTLPTTVQSDTLVFKVSGDNWQGDRHFTVTVDGKQVCGVLTTSASHAAGQTQEITLTGNFGSGAHHVAETFLDHPDKRWRNDRNPHV
ncbi:Ig-like domain-containing protein, partial [Methylobacterium sp. E-041]|uniref:Ig-like domain-containing protein n=1 Tax=Methylobacterium sp. E-041 TaxID=2836573 RepID=UPI001FB9D7D2